MSVSKIEIVEFKNEWNGPNGTVFYHRVRFVNGDEGQIGTKGKLPAKLAVGTEHDYTLTDGKIKINVQQQGAFNNGAKASFKVEPFEHKAAGYAMSYSKDLLVAGRIQNTDDMFKYADQVYNWLISKKQS